MKKAILLSLLGAMMGLQVQAQVNPQEGYVITNDNDTIYGTIDYLTDEQNVKQCLFQKMGETKNDHQNRPHDSVEGVSDPIFKKQKESINWNNATQEYKDYFDKVIEEHGWK